MVDYKLTEKLNILLEGYFQEFLEGRSFDKMMPGIYNEVHPYFETELIEGLKIDWYENRSLIDSFKKNINKWSIARNWQQTREISTYMFNNKGNLTDDLNREFLKGNKSRFNTSWLDNEIRTLRNTTENINNFETFPPDAFLEYRTAADEKVRHAHAELDGLTMPKSDGRWQYLMPPPASSPWNCRCRVIAVYPEKGSSKKDVNKRVKRMSDLSGVSERKVKSATHPLWSGEIFDSKSTYFKGVPKNIMRKNAI